MLAGQATSDVTGGSGPETNISAVWRNGRAKDALLPEDINASVLSDVTDLAQCPLRAFDYNLAGMTAPWGSSYQSDAPASYLFCRGDSSESFDSVILANHNLKDIQTAIKEQDASATLFVELYASDNNAFSGGPSSTRKLVRWEAGLLDVPAAFTERRLVCLDLGTSGSQLGGYPAGYQGKYDVISGASFFQLVIGVDSSSVTYIPSPQIGELFVGPRRQMSRTPNYQTWCGANNNQNIEIASDVTQFTSRSGLETRYGISLGKGLFKPVFTTEGDAAVGTTDLYSLNDLATLESFWKDTQYGANGFFLIPSGGSSSTLDAPFCVTTQAFFPSRTAGGLTEREVSFEFEEIPPYMREEKI